MYTWVTSPYVRPEVITLCGSMRFKDQIFRVAEEQTVLGHIVIAPHSVVAQEDQDSEFKTMLDALHRRKIDLADLIIVVSDESGYYGSSTTGEIAYAEAADIPVEFVKVKGL